MAHAPDILVTSAAQPLLRGLELARLRGIHAHPGHMALAAHLIRQMALIARACQRRADDAQQTGANKPGE